MACTAIFLLNHDLEVGSWGALPGRRWRRRRTWVVSSGRPARPGGFRLVSKVRCTAPRRPGGPAYYDRCRSAIMMAPRVHLESDTRWITWLVGVYTRYIQGIGAPEGYTWYIFWPVGVNLG